MTTFVEILSIIVPALDAKAKISVAKAEELLAAANFDFEEVGYTKVDDPNYIENLFRDLDNGRGIVTIERADAGEVMITYHAECDPFVKANEPTTEPTTEPDTQGGVPATAEDCDAYNRRVVEYIKAEGVDGRVLISAIGLNIGKVPTAVNGEKMGQYFKRYPELFVVDPLYVTLRGCETGKEPVSIGKVWTMDECEQYIRAVIDYILANGENRVAHLSKVGHYVGKVPTESTGVKLSQYLKQYPELFDVDTYYVTLKEGAESYQPKVTPAPTPTPAEQGEQPAKVKPEQPAEEKPEKPAEVESEKPAEVEPEQPILGEQPAEVDEPKPVVQPAEVDEPMLGEQPAEVDEHTQPTQGAPSPQVERPEQTVQSAKSVQEAQTVQEVQTVQYAKPVQEVAASLYDLDHFAAFDDREAALSELAQLAEPEGWVVLPEDEPNRYLMVEAKLRLNFAMAVKELLKGESRDILIAPNAASFDTRFRTADGKSIVARFIFNRRRSEDSWQQYRFDSFGVK